MVLKFSRDEIKRYFPHHILSEIIHDGTYDVCEGNLFVDCGAQVGMVSMFVRERFKKVLAYEASPEAFEHLAENIILDDASNVKLFNRAVTDHPGEVRFGINPGNQTMSQIHPDGQVIVKAITLGEIVGEYGPIDWLKLDIEGAEEPVIMSDEFRRMSEARLIGNIIIEFHFNQDRLVPVLKSMGYIGERINTLMGSEVWRFHRG